MLVCVPPGQALGAGLSAALPLQPTSRRSQPVSSQGVYESTDMRYFLHVTLCCYHRLTPRPMMQSLRAFQETGVRHFTGTPTWGGCGKFWNFWKLFESFLKAWLISEEEKKNVSCAIIFFGILLSKYQGYVSCSWTGPKPILVFFFRPT